MMDNEIGDDDLIARIHNGDRAAFGLLLERHYGFMFKSAFLWTRNRADAEDVAQECCIKLARAIHGFGGRAKLTSWLYRMVIHTAIDMKRAARVACVPVPDDMPDMAGLNGEARMMVLDDLRRVDNLPDKEKMALILVLHDGMTHAEASTIMDVQESTVSWYIHEARKKLNEAPSGREQHHG